MASVTHRNLLLTTAQILPLILFAACSRQSEIIEGPGIDREVPVEKIVVEELRSREGSQVVVTDNQSIRSALNIFGKNGWQKRHGELVPHYRIQLFTPAGQPLTYWLGTYSDPPRFPCYWFCSGFWLAGTDRDGKLNRSLYKSLATSGDMFVVSGLLHPISERTQ